jgi:hypothetical protein
MFRILYKESSRNFHRVDIFDNAGISNVLAHTGSYLYPRNAVSNIQHEVSPDGLLIIRERWEAAVQGDNSYRYQSLLL